MTNKKAPTNTTKQMEENPWGLIAEGMVSKDPSGPIERMEARGQKEFTESDTLPLEFLPYDKAADVRSALESWGVKFLGPVDGDPIFQYVELPKGWKKEPAPDHSMWSYLLDDQGKRRAAIFYKAAFYDRRAHLFLEEQKPYSRPRGHRTLAEGGDGGEDIH